MEVMTNVLMMLCCYNLVVSGTLQEVAEVGLDQLAEKDPQLVALLRTFSDEISELKNKVQTLTNDREVAELTKIRLDNFDLKNELEALSKNFSKIEQEVSECRTKFASLHRYRRKGTHSDRIYSPRTDRTASRDVVVPSTNETALQQVLKLLAPATCYDWMTMGFDTSGYYLIDPDGKGLGDPPFIAYCDMYTGYSFVHHDKEDGGNATKCNGPGCYKQKLTYEASMKQIEALIDTSQSCQQMISVDCRDSPLSENEAHYSWWTDRNGDPMTYWAADNAQGHACSCSFSKSCVDPRKMCNCDSSVAEAWLHDQGYLSNASALPVTSLHLGSKDELTETQMRYSIGPLRCFGRRNVQHPETCKDLRLSGVTHSGYHYVGSFDSPTLVFCDMRNVDNDFIWKRSSVYFYAGLGIRWKSTNQIVKFERVSINVGDAYDSSSGVFTCPQTGTYYFVVFGYISSGGDIRLRKNQEQTVRAIHSSGSWVTTGLSYIVHLEVGDVIDLYLTGGEMHQYGAGELSSFMGMLLK